MAQGDVFHMGEVDQVLSISARRSRVKRRRGLLSDPRRKEKEMRTEKSSPNHELQPLSCLQKHLAANNIFGPVDSMGADCDRQKVLSIIGLQDLLFLEDLGLDVNIDGFGGIGGLLVGVFEVFSFINHAAAAR